MEYLLLWSGDLRGMRKSRIPAIEARGLVGHWRDGRPLVPCPAALRAALPYRFRKAFDRAGGALWFDKRRNDAPARATLTSKRGRPLVTIYLQPLTKGS